jgi:hypothetical protein
MQSLRGFSASTGFGNPSYHFGSFLAYVSRRMPSASGLRAVGSLLASLVTSRQLALAVGSLLASLVTSRQPAAPRARLPAAPLLHLPQGVSRNGAPLRRRTSYAHSTRPPQKSRYAPVVWRVFCRAAESDSGSRADRVGRFLPGEQSSVAGRGTPGVGLSHTIDATLPAKGNRGHAAMSSPLGNAV